MVFDSASTEAVAARFIEPGDIIFIENEWRMVTSTWVHPRSPYNRIGTVGEGKSMKDIALASKLYLDTKFYRRKSVNTRQVHFSTAIEEMVTLQVAIEEYDRVNNLPEKVSVVGTTFQIDSVIIQRECHERMMASFNRLSNSIKAVKKP